MSWLTQFARTIGLGPVLDGIEKAEASPTPENIGAAVAGIVTGVPNAVPVAIEDLGNLAGSVVTGAIAKVSPQLASVEAGLAGPFLARLEAWAIAEASALTGGIIPNTPPVSMSPIPNPP